MNWNDDKFSIIEVFFYFVIMSFKKTSSNYKKRHLRINLNMFLYGFSNMEKRHHLMIFTSFSTFSPFRQLVNYFHSARVRCYMQMQTTNGNIIFIIKTLILFLESYFLEFSKPDKGLCTTSNKWP